MNETLINNWNSVVDDNDEVYHLGDVAFGRPELAKHFLDSIKGKIYLIKGNHEKAVLQKDYNVKRFEWIKDYYELKLSPQQMICLFHYPIGSWNKAHYKSIMLHGHCHNSYKGGFGRIMDVGVDNPLVNFTPISLDAIMNIMESRTPSIVDHHVAD